MKWLLSAIFLIFITDDAIISSLETQTNKSPAFACPDCGRNYKYKHGLTAHQKYECGKDAMFQCMFCPFRAKQKSNLKKHLFGKHYPLPADIN